VLLYGHHEFGPTAHSSRAAILYPAEQVLFFWLILVLPVWSSACLALNACRACFSMGGATEIVKFVVGLRGQGGRTGSRNAIFERRAIAGATGHIPLRTRMDRVSCPSVP